ncbi:MAG: hypothetical protein Q8R28_04500 [Dehalococcoidia bacterium]|nr:hypothetical protein [Dehalococcoidia bacterium]
MALASGQSTPHANDSVYYVLVPHVRPEDEDDQVIPVVEKAIGHD